MSEKKEPPVQKVKKDNKVYKHTNKLINSTSPYLLQHAHNPVDWQPWGKEAFAEAKERNVPIFLSVGYATCHWCHVMERESFEDEKVATFLNEHYVCIKVDREERPDVDAVYMMAVHISSRGNGGWPMSVFLTPDKDCFFAGTYFPKVPMHQRPSFTQVIEHFAKRWKVDPKGIKTDSKEITKLVKLNLDQSGGSQVQLEWSMVEQIANYYNKTLDSQYGGLRGQQMKFPTPHRMTLMLRHYKRSKNRASLEFVEKTLEGMRQGGIHDHLGGGFHRYSTDPQWLVPHFEKMLYDQALLATAYLEAYQITKKEIYADTARDIFNYVLRKMTDSGGAFYSAEDADSEGVEGKFYHWHEEEIVKHLGSKRAEHFCKLFRVKSKGNFSDPHNPNQGENILHLDDSLEEVARSFKMEVKVFRQEIEESKEVLFSKRVHRIHPLKDDKILTAWNGLMISAFALGGRYLDDPKLTRAAEKASQFILDNLQKKGRLLRSYREGQQGDLGYLDDYAFFIHGLIDLYQSSFDPHWLKEALRLNREMTRLFKGGKGALLFSGSDGERLISKRKSSEDGARPAGNSIAALNYLRLGHLTSDTKLSGAGIKILEEFSMNLKKNGASSTQLAVALDYHLSTRQEIVIVGNLKNKDTQAMLRYVNSLFLPRAAIIVRSRGKSKNIDKYVPYIKDYKKVDGKSTAYICSNYVCHLPVTSVEEMKKLLETKSKNN
jgi:uncharacterized protein YyaL (SSP411 family)